MIKHFVPRSFIEALNILDKYDCYIMAGGTDLMLQKHRSSGLLPAFDKHVLYISNLKELDYISLKDDGVHIGAATKYSRIVNDKNVPELLKDAIKELASPNIRNMATLAGNIANASPAGDSLVTLYLLDASIILASRGNERKMLVKDFIKGVRRIDRKSNELIKEIVIPPQDLKTKWKKVGSRSAESISKISFAGGYRLNGDIVEDFRVAFGSVNVTVVRNKEIENKYIGLSLEELKAKVEQIKKDYNDLISPIDDHRSTAKYRRKVAMNILEDFIMNME